MQSDFREQLDLVHRLGLQAAQQIEVNLAVEADDHEYNITGNFFYVKDAPDSEVYVKVKVNSSDQPAVSWSKQTGFRHPFDRLYITTPAGQAGIMKILIAAESPLLFEIIDNRSVVSEATEDILNELRGDVTPENWNQATIGLAQSQVLAANVDRKSFSIQAKSTNTGIVYVGFDTTVTAAKWWAELQPGQSCGGDDYRGPLHAIATVAAQAVGYAEV